MNVLTGRAYNSAETRAASSGRTRFDFPDSALRGFQLCVLRGRTGCGKTSVLNALATLGYQTLNLEGHAHHRGSAFGDLGMPEQPTPAEFLHRLHARWAIYDPARPLFVEFSGAYLGSVTIPPALAKGIDRADWIQLVASETQRIESIVATYAAAGQKRLLSATKRLRGRFPPESLSQVRKAVRQQRFHDAVHLLLPYYDAAYDHQMAMAGGRCLQTVEVDGRSPQEVAAAILQRPPEPALADEAAD